MPALLVVGQAPIRRDPNQVIPHNIDSAELPGKFRLLVKQGADQLPFRGAKTILKDIFMEIIQKGV